MLLVKGSADGHCDVRIDQTLSVCHQMIARLLCLISRRACQHGHIQASALKASQSVGNGHIHIVHVIDGHVCRCQIGCQKLMKIGAHRACNGLARKALRACEALILAVKAEGSGRTAVHIHHLDIRSVGCREDHGGGTYRIKHLYIP